MITSILATSIGRASSAARRAWVAAALAGLLAACGSSAGATQGPGSTSGSESGATATPAAVATADGGGGGGANLDIQAIGNALVPPNSTEVTRTVAADTWFVMYETTDSIDSLKSFYADAIPKTGLQIVATTTINGGVSWAFANDASGSFGGAVNVFPSSDGKNAVQVTIGKN